jgi:hypothetical protein
MPVTVMEAAARTTTKMTAVMLFAREEKSVLQ